MDASFVNLIIQLADKLGIPFLVLLFLSIFVYKKVWPFWENHLDQDREDRKSFLDMMNMFYNEWKTSSSETKSSLQRQEKQIDRMEDDICDIKTSIKEIKDLKKEDCNGK